MFDDLGTVLVILAIICGIVGWALIEILIWLWHNVSITIQ
jgi:hypothetical protein